jgi:DamX protein
MVEKVVKLVNQGEQVAVEAPSAVAPERFVYLTPGLEKLIEALIRSVNDPGILTIVSGEQGSGKTVLLQQFLRQARAEWELCLIQPSHVIGEKHILEQLNNRYFPHNQYDVETLAERLVTTVDKQWPVILVDNAQNLSSFALDVLLSLKSSVEEQGGRLGLIFFALPTIQALMTSPSLHRHNEAVRVIDMPALTELQTTEYIDKLLEASGVASSQYPTTGQKQAIFRRSQGCPGLINPLLTQLVKKQGRKSSGVTEKLSPYLQRSRLWIGAAMVLVLAYGISNYLLPWRDNTFGTDLSPAERGPLVADSSGVEPQQDKQSHSKTPIGTNNKAVKKDDGHTAAVIQQRKSPAQVKTQTSVTPVNNKKVAQNPVEPLPTPVTSSPLPAAQMDQINSRTDDAANPPQINAMSNEPVNGKDWLLSQNRGDYTIQLAASANEEAIQRFIRTQPVIDGLRYVHILRRGKNGYVTLFGSYPTFSLAKQAISDLPESMRKNEPWIRRISALQDMVPDYVPVAAASSSEEATTAQVGLDSPAIMTSTPVLVETPVPAAGAGMPDDTESNSRNNDSSTANPVVAPAVLSLDSAGIPAPSVPKSE